LVYVYLFGAGRNFGLKVGIPIHEEELM